MPRSPARRECQRRNPIGTFSLVPLWDCVRALQGVVTIGWSWKIASSGWLTSEWKRGRDIELAPWCDGSTWRPLTWQPEMNGHCVDISKSLCLTRLAVWRKTCLWVLKESFNRTWVEWGWVGCTGLPWVGGYINTGREESLRSEMRKIARDRWSYWGEVNLVSH